MHGTLDEEDLALIHALQIAPRVSWSQAAPILGISPARLAARWERLRGDRLAWVTAYPVLAPEALTMAWVEVDCTPGARPGVVRRLCQDPRAVTVEESARGRDLLVTVIVRDLPELTRFVLDDLTALEGVAAQRTYLVTEVHFEGSRWQLDSLESRQVEQLKQLPSGSFRRGQRAGVPSTPPPDAWPLIEALSEDGRISSAELARKIGRNPATTRRQLARLLASERLSLRCEMAHVQSRWPISCSLLGRVPQHELAKTVQALVTLPELRLCASTTGETNLMFTVWVHSMTDLLRLEGLLGRQLPWLNIVDTTVNLRIAKRMGWLLDAHGRCTGEVVPLTAAFRQMTLPQ